MQCGEINTYSNTTLVVFTGIGDWELVVGIEN